MNDIDIVEIMKERFAEGWWPVLDVGEGWRELLENLHQELIEVAPDYQLHQVKEKFGGLRFYFDANIKNDAAIERAQDIVDKYEDLSWKVCEITGKPGKVVSRDGWRKVLCPELAAEHGYS